MTHFLGKRRHSGGNLQFPERTAFTEYPLPEILKSVGELNTFERGAFREAEVAYGAALRTRLEAHLPEIGTAREADRGKILHILPDDKQRVAGVVADPLGTSGSAQVIHGGMCR